MKRALFVFRRDLRLEDNLALQAALQVAKEVILAFIFTPEQIKKNAYRSDPALQFMIESLQDLEKEIKKKGGRLYLFYGSPQDTVERVIKTLQIEAVFVNRDYTPYSTKRDKEIEKVCGKYHIPFESYDDLLLHPGETSLKKDASPYVIFTPFYKAALKLPIKKPLKNLDTNYYSKEISFAKKAIFYESLLPKRLSQPKGGRFEALKILTHLKAFAAYEKEKDFPYLDKTTHLSCHLKFNTCSTREVYQAMERALGSEHGLIRSLYWREFYTLIAYHFPHVFGHAFHSEYDLIRWENKEKLFKLWCEGRTGFPIVDAGMRQLNETGFMPNRVRMITASFLVKDLHIDWRWGEKYFASKLMDYDPAINNGNWQWVASTGCDVQPYFRIFNPWTQAKKFDPDGLYIKKWIGELKTIPAERLHTWYLETKSKDYPLPIVDHAKEAKKAVADFKRAFLL